LINYCNWFSIIKYFSKPVILNTKSISSPGLIPLFATKSIQATTAIPAKGAPFDKTLLVVKNPFNAACFEPYFKASCAIFLETNFTPAI
jgi:hypothetical protein